MPFWRNFDFVIAVQYIWDGQLFFIIETIKEKITTEEKINYKN